MKTGHFLGEFGNLVLFAGFSGFAAGLSNTGSGRVSEKQSNRRES